MPVVTGTDEDDTTAGGAGGAYRWWSGLRRTRPGARRRRWWAWVAGGLVVTLTVAAGITAVTFPVVAAVACPACRGLDRLADGVYAEPGQTPVQRRQVLAVLATADERIRAFYGSRRSRPRVLVCRTPACYHRIGGGGEKGQSVLDVGLILSPDGINGVIAAHELAHVEFHERLGGARRGVPQWFDEGLAVLVADDPRYLAPVSAADRCLVEPGGPLPTTGDRWRRAATADPDTYARAACVVSRWVAGHGGPPAVTGLIGKLSGGAHFDAVVPG
jgi:hypothetical protein